MVSIIIPTYNEAEKISHTISKIHEEISDQLIEIIVIDGGSTDNTVSIAKQSKAKVLLNRKGRAAQMNKGGFEAKGEILYFLHGDSVPPQNFINHILDAHANGAVAGCFKLAFDHEHWFLKINCWFTRFNLNVVRFGDQSLFVTKAVFEKCNGFREDLYIMEDQEIIHRIRKYGKFKVMNGVVTTSARKYLQNGIYRMQSIFYMIWTLYYLGSTQDYLVKLHKKLIRQHKL